ncbi:MAG: HTTM domain-containing protein [Chitinophagales bacterium]|nr:HTTM domain-containing protein [Chitinophagales bacterium]
MYTRNIKNYFSQYAEAAPLAVFRILFGTLMFISLLRFYANGWIEKLYLEPSFFFSYTGFEWIKPLGSWTYLIFVLGALSAIGVALGYRYRLSATVFFLSFTYIELMDKTTYLNHYYFVSLVSFLMILLPANAYFSVDALKNENLRKQYIPAWTIDAIKLMLAIVYFYAGLAKLNSDWLFHAMPLKIWLSAKTSLPVIGPWLQESWVHYAFSWAGMIYDLSIPFLLLWPRTRLLGFTFVVIFHVVTRLLFPIGMFPFIMILSTLIFFSADFHHRFLHQLSRILRLDKRIFDNRIKMSKGTFTHLLIPVIVLFFVFQLTLPFRYVLQPGELFWTEQGYRFSWRVMLMEKAGYANFKVVDSSTGKRFYVDNSQFLTPFQEKQMATQPDFILEYALYLEQYYQQQGIADPEIYVESYVSLNGRGSQPYVNPDIDLTQQDISPDNRNWILPFNDEIKGL